MHATELDLAATIAAASKLTGYFRTILLNSVALPFANAFGALSE